MRSPIAVVGLGLAGRSLIASARRAHIDVVAKARRLRALTHTDQWLLADTLFLAVPDDAIEEVAAELSRSKKQHLPALVVHMSGARGQSPLAALTHRTAVGCFHPLASLDGKNPIPDGTLVAVDASTRAATAKLTRLARRLRCKPAHIAEKDRVAYHAGAVVAGNLATALLARGVDLLVDAGVPPGDARVALASLLRSTADNAAGHVLADALTGPVRRGDVHTVERHLAYLDAAHPSTAAIYRELSRVLVDEVAAHAPQVKRRLRQALK